MSKPITLTVILIAAIALLGGCANGEWTAGDTGSILGGVAGGAAGHQIGGGSGKTIATVAGAIAGSILGRRLGNKMSQRDRQQFGHALAGNSTGQTDSWSNSQTNNHYTVTPTSDSYQHDNRTCREFRMKAEVNGQPDHVTGTACRQPDGSWVIQQ